MAERHKSNRIKRIEEAATIEEEKLASLEEDIAHYSEPEEKEVEQDSTVESFRKRNFTVSKQGTKERTMSMIDPNEWSLDDSQEPYALKDGSEAALRIIDVRFDTRDDNSSYYTIRMEVPSEPFSKEITDWLNVPNRELDAKRLNVARRRMLHFMQCFSIDTTQLSDPLEDWPGQEGWAILNLSKSDQYGEQNRITKYIVPR